MAGKGFFDFPEEFFYENSRSPEIIYGNIHPEFYDLYASTIGDSDTYAEMNDVEKLFIADEFMELFWYGGYSQADQEAWLAVLGIGIHDFDWEEYKSVYESIVYG